jgi:hypothetical protein
MLLVILSVAAGTAISVAQAWRTCDSVCEAEMEYDNDVVYPYGIISDTINKMLSFSLSPGLLTSLALQD